jgi:glycosyltransferase involved in cell wall biosynthesis
MVQVDLSFVVPAYNEEEFIENALFELDEVIKGRNLPYEIVVVDDGSQDNTLNKAKVYASRNGHVKVMSYDQNVGKGYAVKQGFMETNGQVVVFVDSDNDIDIGTIQSYIDALKYGDIVVATKWHPESQIQMPMKRRILSHGFNVLVRILIGAQLKDTQVGLKVMRKSAFTKIFPRLCVKRYAFDVELLAVANLYGLKITQMPTKLRINGMFNVKDVFKMFVDLLGIAYRLRITHWYQRPIDI